MQICYGAEVGLGRMTAHALSSPKRTGRVRSARGPSQNKPHECGRSASERKVGQPSVLDHRRIWPDPDLSRRCAEVHFPE
jgi:hypothetical protein